ncbi:MAG TPA: LamG-like jellyroll fold domain-containing protein, partial [Flavobacterium sp.]
AQGRTGEADCGFIQRVEAYETPYANVEEARPTDINPTNYSNSDLGANVASVTATEETFCCGTQPQCTTLTGSLSNGVLAFYPFGNGSLADLSGNGNNLSNSTGAFPTPDRDNNRACAYRFSNTDFLTTTASAFLDGLTTSPFSISLWYQPIGTRSGGNYELLVGRGSTGLHCPDTWSEWSVGLYDCRKAVVGFDQYSHWQASPTGMGCEADMAAISNTWHHLAFVYDGSSYKLYIDGTLHSSSSGPCGPMSANLGPLMLGVDYNGDLDDIVIYNRSISAAEVVALRSLNGSCCDDTISFSKIPDTFKAQSTTKPDNVAGITLYPNPSDGRVSVLANNNIRSIAVYSSTGVLTGTYTFNAKEVSLNIEHLASGFYYLKIVTEAGSSVEKLIKN